MSFISELQATAQMVARNLDQIKVPRETLTKLRPIERLFAQPDKTRTVYDDLSVAFLTKRAPLTLQDVVTCSEMRNLISAQCQLFRLIAAQLVELVESAPGGDIGIVPLQAGTDYESRRLPLPPLEDGKEAKPRPIRGRSRRDTIFNPWPTTAKLTDDPMLTLAQAEAYSGVPAKWFRCAVGKGALRAQVFTLAPGRWSPGGTTLLILMSDMLDWLCENETELVSRGFVANIQFETAPARAWKLQRRLAKAGPLLKLTSPQPTAPSPGGRRRRPRKEATPRVAGPDPYLSISEAASLVPISTTLVRAAIKSGQLKAKRYSPDAERELKPRWFVKASAVLEWFDHSLY